MKMNPIPVRLESVDQEALNEISGKTGLSRGDIIRRACKYILPKFQSGELPIVAIDQKEGLDA